MFEWNLAVRTKHCYLSTNTKKVSYFYTKYVGFLLCFCLFGAKEKKNKRLVFSGFGLGENHWFVHGALQQSFNYQWWQSVCLLSDHHGWSLSLCSKVKFSRSSVPGAFLGWMQSVHKACCGVKASPLSSPTLIDLRTDLWILIFPALLIGKPRKLFAFSWGKQLSGRLEFFLSIFLWILLVCTNIMTKMPGDWEKQKKKKICIHQSKVTVSGLIGL